MKRRDFLKKTTATAAGTFILPRFSIGQAGPSANSKLNIAMIGVGNIGGMAIRGCKNENIVALVDVDSRLLHSGEKRFPQLKKAAHFEDYRVMLDKLHKEIDGVCINTPDHTHFVATIDSMKHGLHVCTQKPLTHNIWEARTLRKAKDVYGVVTNMANQGHTSDGIRQMRDWVDADVFGQIKEVHMASNGPEWSKRYFEIPKTIPLKPTNAPDHLNWDLWLGPKPHVPYNPIYHPLSWRGFYEYGQGTLGDWFPHTGDGPVWALDLYEPSVIECVERGPSPMEGMIPEHSVIRWDFPARGDKAPCSAYWYDGIDNGGRSVKTPTEWDLGTPSPTGSYWFGEKQNGYLDDRSSGGRLSTKQAMRSFNKGKDIPVKHPTLPKHIKGPHEEWVEVIKGNLPACGSNFDYASRLTEVACLGVIAQRVGGRIEWDAAKGRITNRPELNVYLKETVRPGWERGEGFGDEIFKNRG